MVHSTNYTNTLIEIAQDSKNKKATIPLKNIDKKSVALHHFELISENPYIFTSDEILFNVARIRNAEKGIDLTMESFFSMPQACFRTSALCKNYGWGIHFNDKDKMALIAVESISYKKLIKDKKVVKVKALQNTKQED